MDNIVIRAKVDNDRKIKIMQQQYEAFAYEDFDVIRSNATIIFKRLTLQKGCIIYY